MQGESSFQTPMSLAQDIPANEELGRGFRVRKAAAIVGPPYTQQGSTTPIPKKAKGRGGGRVQDRRWMMLQRMRVFRCSISYSPQVLWA